VILRIIITFRKLFYISDFGGSSEFIIVKGNSKAAVAAASKLLKVVYWVMKEKSIIHQYPLA
jgi:hypothetical protein